MKLIIKQWLILLPLFGLIIGHAQEGSISGTVSSTDGTIGNIQIKLLESDFQTTTNNSGFFILENIPVGSYTLQISDLLYKPYQEKIQIIENESLDMDIYLEERKEEMDLNDIVISGTMKAVQRDKSPVPVEVYSQTYFKKNPTPNMFEALQNVNGVRPQVNCNVCNTGDIHINGLEGPYTMVLIDGMPIVSSLGTVYGLSGIPNALIERIEVVKGPASSLYGSEAVGGLINIITKKTKNADKFSADVMATSWQEYNADLGYKFNIGENVDVLTGVNYYNYSNPIDNNDDNFTDVTLQDRISVFQKWNFKRPENRLFSIAGRYLYEDRWGGDMNWNKSYRGGEEVYGESIYTSRAELIGNYQLPLNEKMFFSFSFISHDQDSRYGSTSYIADQKIGFGQLTWDKKAGMHDLLTGVALRYTYYDDNTPATLGDGNLNIPEKDWLPGIFIQDEMNVAPGHNLLLGMRYDHNQVHGNIFTPRVAYKWQVNSNNILRLNAGTGFRVVNLFTEDHAALTGARDVVIENDLEPEKSYNANLNFIKKIHTNSGALINLDASAFYTYFNNRIVPDYDTNPQQIIYDNLDGHAESKGISLNSEIKFRNGLDIILGATLMENTITENGVTEEPEFAENFMGTWAASYKINAWNLAIDYTGNVYSPMNLPLVSDLDPRKPESPWWSIQNIQLTYDGLDNFEIYGGVKNLLNWTPNEGNPFIIARTNDPFDQEVDFDQEGNAIATPENPYALVFDPAYVYASNQGIRGFLGLRYIIR
ncbi:TonB-dependent receptor plug domain-containing protein [Flavobacteriaceae bacterium Ap0902]|nr:TonB-dependent receptor plug domain-containing protein [Flavobacteriaceae bacterium Ap0902]